MKNNRKKRWQERENNNKCIYCGNNPPKNNRKGCENCLKKKVDASVKFCKNNKKSNAQYRLLIKYDVIQKYGNKCKCCNESQILFLTIDHKNNDGNVDRLKNFGIKNPPTISWYLKLRRELIRDDLQVLCFNCNLGKSLNNGICPHQKINRILEPISDRRHEPQFDKRLKIVWPIDNELIKMCNSISTSQTAKNLGVSFSAVSNRLKRRNKYHLVQKKFGRIKNGEINAAAKITENDITIIRQKYFEGISRKILSQEYEVSKSLIDKIVNFQIWKQISDERNQEKN